MSSSLTIESVIEAEINRGYLTPSGVSASITPHMQTFEVYHHEWARAIDEEKTPGLICVMWAGFGSIFVHNLDTKELLVVDRGYLSHLRILDL